MRKISQARGVGGLVPGMAISTPGEDQLF